MHPDWNINRVIAVAMWNTYSGAFHFVLDMAGLVPVIGEAADLANAGIYFVEGDHLNASFSAAAAVPVYGWVSTGGKWVRSVGKVLSRPLTEAAGRVAYRAVKSSRGAVRFIKVAVGDFTHLALKSVKATKPADKTLTNLSKTILEQMAHRVKPFSATLRSKIDDIVLHLDLRGTKTEALCDEMYESSGFVKYDAKFGSNNGFDGVYIKHDAAGNVQEIIINEAKQVTAVGNIKLAARTPNKGPQMSDEWLNQTIEEMKNSNLNSLGSLLDLNKSKITKTVTGVDKATSEIVILKLSKY
jgi:hypothetical protein